LIETIIAGNPLYTFDALAGLSIQDLNLLATSRNTNLENMSVSGVASDKEYIGEDKAKTIALNHAKVTSPKNLVIEFDYDDGVMVYDVEFYFGGTEYDYEINAKTGAIIESHKEVDDDYVEKPSTNSGSSSSSSSSSSNTTSNRNKAINVALKHAGLSKSDVKDLSCEYDYENGVAVYEVEFETRDYEYSYDIDAKTFKVLHVEKDKED